MSLAGLDRGQGKGSGDLARGVAADEGPGVEEHKEVERDLGRRSGRAGVVGGGPATELCSGWRRQVAAVALQRS
jgi:hypothetical protein